MKDLILRLTDKGVASMTGNNNHIFLKELKEREKMSYAELIVFQLHVYTFLKMIMNPVQLLSLSQL